MLAEHFGELNMGFVIIEGDFRFADQKNTLRRHASAQSVRAGSREIHSIEAWFCAAQKYQK